MDQHLAACQIADFILGGLDEDELEEVYRHPARYGRFLARYPKRSPPLARARSSAECTAASWEQTSKREIATLS
jgi:hypothetical protein